MQTVINQPTTVKLTIYSKEITKDGKTFTVYETTDSHKNRVSVSFTLNGKKPPEKSDFPIVIECENGVDIWEDNRKRFPIYRIANYKLIETKHAKQTRGIPTD